jgi:DNA ligase (NAD+)
MSKPTLPTNVSLRKLKLNDSNEINDYLETLNRIQVIGLAEYLDYNYHTLNKSLVSDEAYDIVRDHITAKWPKSLYLKRVGHAVVKRKGVVEVQLPVPMPSMDKIKSGNGSVAKFTNNARGTYVVSDKLDGISLELMYTNGVLTNAYTRGNGIKGQDVSGVIAALDCPKKIAIRSTFIVRLEFLVPTKHFNENYSKHEGKGDFATGRNMGGGLLLRNEPSARVKSFHCVAYGIVGGKGSSDPISKQLATLKQLKFRVVAFKRISGILDDARLTKIHDLRKKKSIYDIDGIIVAKDIAAAPTRSNPKHAKAFKINSIANSKVVSITKIEWRKSRHGKWIPRIHIDPIILGGVEVQHLTGHNAYYITHGFKYQDRAKGLPVRPMNVGTQIRVIRSGDVIPYIMEVVKPSRTASVPSSPYTQDPNGVHYLTGNLENDEDVVLKNIIHFFNAMEIEGVKTGVVSKLRAAGYRTIKSIINASASDFMEIEGFQQRSAVNLEKSIQKGLKEANFVRTASASCVFGDKIGTRKLQELIDHYPNIMDMAKLPKEELATRIREVRMFANLSDKIAEGLPKLVKFVAAHGIVIKRDKGPESTKLASLSVLFTSVRDADLAKHIKNNGGKLAGTVKQANLLITKEGASNNKTEQAAELGIPVMTVDQFKRKYKIR